MLLDPAIGGGIIIASLIVITPCASSPKHLRHHTNLVVVFDGFS